LSALVSRRKSIMVTKREILVTVSNSYLYSRLLWRGRLLRKKNKICWKYMIYMDEFKWVILSLAIFSEASIFRNSDKSVKISLG
jgi:hypothetical protein